MLLSKDIERTNDDYRRQLDLVCEALLNALSHERSIVATRILYTMAGRLKRSTPEELLDALAEHLRRPEIQCRLEKLS